MAKRRNPKDRSSIIYAGNELPRINPSHTVRWIALKVIVSIGVVAVAIGFAVQFIA